jgi:hypothetical protein
MNYQKIVLAFIMAAASLNVSAQKKNTGKVQTFAKYKVPKLHTYLGSYKDSTGISVIDATNLITTPLKIVDDKKNVYSISSYQFLYKKKGVTEDEQTERTSPVTTISSARFKASPLPAIWINTIQQQLKAGEEMYFFDVIAKDAQGRVMYAPNLKLTVL